MPKNKLIAYIYQKRGAMAFELIDETGKKYHWLTVLERGEPPNPEIMQAWWICKCDCGNYALAPGHDLRRGRYKSCGCYKIKRASIAANVDREHPQHHWKRNHPAYQLWTGMIKACYSKNHNRYIINGMQGRTVCKEWLNSADDFLKWIDGNDYKKGDSLYIPPNEKEYSPETCSIMSRSDAISRRIIERLGIDHSKYIGKQIGAIRVINKIVILKPIKQSKGKEWREISWVCECSCGKKCVKRTGDLNSGRDLSCGCRNRVSDWSVDYKECTNCKKTTSPYAANGVCRRCYFGLERDPTYQPNPRWDIKNRWSLICDSCVLCGTTERKHHTHGYCTLCRQKKEVKEKFKIIK